MLDRYMVSRLIDLWLAEDIGNGDLTCEVMIEPEARGAFHMNARQKMTVAGIDVAAMVFEIYDPDIEVEVVAKDGQRADKGTRLLTVSGRARSLLTAERPALNIVQHLSGIATDHRLGLDGGVLVKDNHIAVFGSIKAAVERARDRIPTLTKIEVECDRIDQVREALAAKADIVLLDNMALDEMRECVKLVNGQIPVEASGGVRFETLRGIAETGVDFISTSRITQAAPGIDIGLDDA